MKMPKAIIPVHTCELDWHQSISHTCQPNPLPREPINLLCHWLNGQRDASEQVLEKAMGEQRGFGERRAPRLPITPDPRPLVGGFKTPLIWNFRSPWKLGGSRELATRLHLPSQPTNGATIKPEADSTRVETPASWGQEGRDSRLRGCHALEWNIVTCLIVPGQPPPHSPPPPRW